MCELPICVNTLPSYFLALDVQHTSAVNYSLTENKYHQRENKRTSSELALETSATEIRRHNPFTKIRVFTQGNVNNLTRGKIFLVAFRKENDSFIATIKVMVVCRGMVYCLGQQTTLEWQKTGDTNIEWQMKFALITCD